ncbi:MAG TPA: competence/damage-inducible protein A [Fimbriimonadaceae bacterium]|nr:competence/damage-inducible protein A [Fimbriimonadaceae bacterium]
MIAEIVSVGTEILMGQIVDSNAREIGALLPRYGIRHYYRQTVGDNLDRLTEALRLALSRSDIVFTIGGLGPTEDDLTRDGVAKALAVEMVEDPKIVNHLKALFDRRGIPWTGSQFRQAHRPVGSTVLENPNGSAPGLYIAHNGKHVFLLPGPKGEFNPMLRGPVAQILEQHAGPERLVSQILRITGIGESMVEERLRDLMQADNPTIAPYAKPGEVHLRISALASSEFHARRLIEPVEQEIRSRLGLAVYGTGDEALENALVRLLDGRTLALAESVTGGLAASRITNVPGASKVLKGGLVVYTVDSKRNILGLSDAEVTNPVSSECAVAMAVSVRNRLKADFGLAITGNAGPTSDVGNEPVGLVYVGFADASTNHSVRFQFQGSRANIRERACQAMLHVLYEQLCSKQKDGL